MKLLSIFKSSSKCSSNAYKLFWIKFSFTPLIQERIIVFFRFCESERTCPYFRYQSRRRPNRSSRSRGYVAPRLLFFDGFLVARVIFTFVIGSFIFYVSRIGGLFVVTLSFVGVVIVYLNDWVFYSFCEHHLFHPGDIPSNVYPFRFRVPHAIYVAVLIIRVADEHTMYTSICKLRRSFCFDFHRPSFSPRSQRFHPLRIISIEMLTSCGFLCSHCRNN
jgi:hypothetical protein